MESTLYASCPGCASLGLVRHVGETYRCAACGFDYATLRSDTAARERWMLGDLRRGPMGQLTVLYLHHALLGGPQAESNARVVAFAEAHGIALPTGAPLSPLVVMGVVLGGVVALVVALLLLLQ